MKGTMEKVGVWSFIIGLVLVIIAAIPNLASQSWIPIVLGILGIIVGLINVTYKESQMYLVAAIALIIGASGLTPLISATVGFASFLTNLLENIVVFVAPGAMIVAIKAIFDIAKSK